MLRRTFSRPVSFGIKHPSGAYDQIFITVRQLRGCLCGALFDERTGLSFTIAAGPRQGSHFRVRVPLDSRSHFTLSDSRFPGSPNRGHHLHVCLCVLTIYECVHEKNSTKLAAVGDACELLETRSLKEGTVWHDIWNVGVEKHYI
jgi:hypothetical protein